MAKRTQQSASSAAPSATSSATASAPQSKVRIYRPARTAMQQGRAKTKAWLMEFVTHDKLVAEPIMGWQSSRDTRRQVKLSFETVEQAIAYAQSEGYIIDRIHDDQADVAAPKRKAYADNFRFNKPVG